MIPIRVQALQWELGIRSSSHMGGDHCVYGQLLSRTAQRNTPEELLPQQNPSFVGNGMAQLLHHKNKLYWKVIKDLLCSIIIAYYPI